MSFVSREMELGLLADLYQRERAQLLILYGRRRVGKTRLLTHWAGSLSQPVFYWMATQTSAANQLRDFSQALFRFLHIEAPVPATFSYGSWDAAFSELARASESQRFVAILDEITYVMQANPEVPSLIQRAWDHQLHDSNIFLILTGSLAGIIQRAVLDYQAPLYGRATARLKLQPLSFAALDDMLPLYTTEQRVAVYTMTGGIPAYIEQFDDNLTLEENLKKRIVTPINVMLTDAVFLLREQFEEPRNYMAVLEAIAAGYHRLTKVAEMSGISRTNITKYLSVLQDLGYVERQVSATVRRPERSRRGRYVITDPYLRFYFRFLVPYLADIEQGRVQQVTHLITEQLPVFIGKHTFEELCREWVRIASDRGEMPFQAERVGSYWSQRVQVDVVAVSWRHKRLLLGECKWSSRATGEKVIKDLIAKTAEVVPGSSRWHCYYIIFAKQGFTEGARNWAANHGLLLITLADIASDMQRWLQPQR
ncbi:MAG: ATP-binding protein [Candidatus Promineifilaceae bacterium]|nr:ATP-binding protein [Candidatus Promineifilaceae bacterium]